MVGRLTGVSSCRNGGTSPLISLHNFHFVKTFMGRKSKCTHIYMNDSGLPAKAIDLDEHEKALLNEVLDASPGVSWDAIAGLEEVKRFLANSTG